MPTVCCSHDDEYAAALAAWIHYDALNGRRLAMELNGHMMYARGKLLIFISLSSMPRTASTHDYRPAQSNLPTAHAMYTSPDHEVSVSRPLLVCSLNHPARWGSPPSEDGWGSWGCPC